MKIEVGKKYTLFGDTYEGCTIPEEKGLWAEGPVVSWNEAEFQFFVEKGLVEEVRVPKVVKSQSHLVFDVSSKPCGSWVHLPNGFEGVGAVDLVVTERL